MQKIPNNKCKVANSCAAGEILPTAADGSSERPNVADPDQYPKTLPDLDCIHQVSTHTAYPAIIEMASGVTVKQEVCGHF